MTMRHAILTLILCLAPVATAMAQDTASQAPLEVTAQNTLEWHRNDQRYVATGAATAKQGDVTIAGEKLTADYRETKAKSFDIYQLVADQAVVISSGVNKAFGDHAVYDVDKGVAIMTGKALRMTSPDQTVTATDKFEYDVKGGRLSAIGNAVLTHGDDKLSAPRLSAFFADAQQGGDNSRKLDRMEAEGGVTITTPTEILTGSRGIYHAATETAEIIGNVKITRGPNVLEGERAEVNLVTNVSKMFGKPAAEGGDGRVRGVFYPDQGE